MRYRNLGHSGMLISEIVFGTWFPDPGTGDQGTLDKCVRAALDAGITSFDTADSYSGTWSETALGHALHGQRRAGLELMTKVYWPTGPGVNDRGLSRKHIMESINGSLQRLQTDYVDLYQAHRFDYQTPIEETMLAFADVVRAGKALYIGVSEWTAPQISQAAELARELHVPLVSNQPQYSMLWRVIEAEVVPVCDQYGIGQVAWSPLAQGVLTGKYIPGRRLPAGSRGDGRRGHGDFMDAWLQDEVLKRVNLLVPVARNLGLTLAQLAITWTIGRPSVCAAVLGFSNPAQVAENTHALDTTLDPVVLAEIDDILGDIVAYDPKLTTSPCPRP